MELWNSMPTSPMCSTCWTGRAALVTGGNIVGAHTIAPGEVRGASIDGGTRQELRAGDVAHVPAGLPHQMLVAADRALTCFVIKVRESK
jgi:hypothetical protein